MPADEKQQVWVLFALGSALFAGLTAILGKVGVAGLSSNFATFLRTCVILVFTAAVVGVRGEWAAPTGGTARSWAFLVLSALATGASWLCYYRALQLAPASLVAPIDKLSVVVAIALGVAVLGEPLTWKLAVGGVLIVAGAMVIATA
jgi:transporter family protein